MADDQLPCCTHLSTAVGETMQATRVGRFQGAVAHVEEGRHLHVHVGGLPQRALLGLEPERGERAIVCATFGNPARKQVRGMRLEMQFSAGEGTIGLEMLSTIDNQA